ncbi:YdeI/OmpD-associated family protein [Sphingobacterium spiritivorum]|uniref:YdeI/OmpD-associated family protein n=1 Tax=Sphingobacterium spiritivorum TaxID=258 RepID=UPI003DA6C2C2
MHFTAVIDKIGINPFVYVPDLVLQELITVAGRHKGKIPVSLTIDGIDFTQTLVKYAGEWRLYINGPMLKATGKTVGDTAAFTVKFNRDKPEVQAHPFLAKALQQNAEAHTVFQSLSPSLQLEIVRYISHLKQEDSIARNVGKAIQFLLGKERFIGREPIKKDF